MIDVETLRETADEMLSGLVAGEAARKAIRFKASALSEFPAITTQMLGGLAATPALRHRILLAAQRQTAAKAPVARRTGYPAFARRTPAFGMALALTLMIAIGYVYGSKPQLFPQNAGVETGMDTYAAGSPTTVGIPQYRSLFAGEGANPPLIGINGRYYRMLASPLSVPAENKGSPIADVQDYTDEPSLASVVGIISNVAAVGTPVYEVEGISLKTACLAEVDGVLRLFQRVSYAGSAMIGNEMLEDTLNIRGQVKALELSGVGIIQDQLIADELMYMLYEFGNYSGSEMPSSEQALTIYLKNGLSLQLQVQDDLLGACGSWACPEFFQQFREDVEKLSAG